MQSIQLEDIPPVHVCLSTELLQLSLLGFLLGQQPAQASRSHQFHHDLCVDGDVVRVAFVGYR